MVQYNDTFYVSHICPLTGKPITLATRYYAGARADYNVQPINRMWPFLAQSWGMDASVSWLVLC